jgi:hypothetical protein
MRGVYATGAEAAAFCKAVRRKSRSDLRRRVCDRISTVHRTNLEGQKRMIPFCLMILVVARARIFRSRPRHV